MSYLTFIKRMRSMTQYEQESRKYSMTKQKFHLNISLQKYNK